MTFSNIERQIDRIAPALLLFLGVFTAIATAGIGVA